MVWPSRLTVMIGVTSRNGNNRTLRLIKRQYGQEVTLFDLLVLLPTVQGVILNRICQGEIYNP